jgi:hypothetical protein
VNRCKQYYFECYIIAINLRNNIILPFCLDHKKINYNNEVDGFARKVHFARKVFDMHEKYELIKNSFSKSL